MSVDAAPRLAVERRARRARRITHVGWRTLSALVRLRWSPGWCSICEGRSVFVETDSWLRDGYLCIRCRSLPRARAVVLALGIEVPDWRRRRVYECGPAGPSSRKLARECKHHTWSHLRVDPSIEALFPGVVTQDVHELSFPDEAFDVVVTQDVFEHVPDPRRGFAEIERVLRPGGVHVFTVPCYDRPNSVSRASLVGGELVSDLAPEYHGDPVDRGGALVVTEWGRDLPERIFEASGMFTTVRTVRDRRLGLDGDFLDVFISRKGTRQ